MPSGGGGSTNTIEKSDPWAGEIPSINQGLSAAGSLYSANPSGPAYYPGNTYAGLNSSENTALGSLTNTGLNGTSSFNAANQGVADVAGQSLDPNSNPYLQQAGQNAIAQVLPQIQAGFNSGGRADSGLAASAAASGATQALAGLNYSQYNTDAQQKLQAGLTAPGLYQGALTGDQYAFGAGQAGQTDAQNQITADQNRWDYNQTRPYNALGTFENEINGSGANQGGTTSTQSPYFSNDFANIASGVTAAAAAAPLAAGLAGYGPLASLSLFAASDRRLKENVHEIGEAKNGLAIYAFNYKDHPTPHIGFMADEVEKVHPDAVATHPSGYKMVDYGKAVQPVGGSKRGLAELALRG